jgi:hypothetical protein
MESPHTARAAREHSCVLEAAAIGFEEETGLHTPKAFAVQAARDELRRHRATRIALVTWS